LMRLIFIHSKKVKISSFFERMNINLINLINPYQPYQPHQPLKHLVTLHQKPVIHVQRLITGAVSDHFVAASTRLAGTQPLVAGGFVRCHFRNFDAPGRSLSIQVSAGPALELQKPSCAV